MWLTVIKGSCGSPLKTVVQQTSMTLTASWDTSTECCGCRFCCDFDCSNSEVRSPQSWVLSPSRIFPSVIVKNKSSDTPGDEELKVVIPFLPSPSPSVGPTHLQCPADNGSCSQVILLMFFQSWRLTLKPCRCWTSALLLNHILSPKYKMF